LKLEVGPKGIVGVRLPMLEVRPSLVILEAMETMLVELMLRWCLDCRTGRLKGGLGTMEARLVVLGNVKLCDILLILALRPRPNGGVMEIILSHEDLPLL